MLRAHPTRPTGAGRPDGRKVSAEAAAVPFGPLDSRDIEEVDANVAEAVGAVLSQLLSARVEQAAAIDATFGKDIAEPVSRFALHGGKRLRSQLVWWGLRACDQETNAAEATLQVAAGLELLQTCALVHDDVMDSASLRRGRPAFHSAWDAAHPNIGRPELRPTLGESAAVLAGDLALAWADDMVAAAAVPRHRTASVRAQWQALRTEMAAGQYLDLHGQATTCPSAGTAVRTALLKSALYSVQRPLLLGAALAGADPAAASALSAAGRCAGLAFQLRDDLTDAFGDPERTGKPAGSDIRCGKPTYLVTVAREMAEVGGDRPALALLERCLGNADLSDGDQANVRRTLEDTGARAMVEKDISGLTTQALDHLRTSRGVLDELACRRISDLIIGATGSSRAPRTAPDRVCVHPVIAQELLSAGDPSVEVDTW